MIYQMSQSQRANVSDREGVKAIISTDKAVEPSGELLFYCHAVFLLKVEKLLLIKCKMWLFRNFPTFIRFPCESKEKFLAISYSIPSLSLITSKEIKSIEL